MRLSSLAFVVALAVGCKTSSHSRPPDVDATALDATKVLSIAREAVAASGTWTGAAEFITPVRQLDGSWRVLVLQLPSVAGGHVLISIDANGRVTEYVPGA